MRFSKTSGCFPILPQMFCISGQVQELQASYRITDLTGKDRTLRLLERSACRCAQSDLRILYAGTGCRQRRTAAQQTRRAVIYNPRIFAEPFSFKEIVSGPDVSDFIQHECGIAMIRLLEARLTTTAKIRYHPLRPQQAISPDGETA